MKRSILDYIPPAIGKKPFRLQASLSLEEASALEQILVDPNLPFEGDQTLLVRTLIRWALHQHHVANEIEGGAFEQSIRPVLGHELLRWSKGACDSYAMAAVDHLALALDASETKSAENVLEQVIDTFDSMKNDAAKAMLRKALIQRGFLSVVDKLTSRLLEEDSSPYWVDSSIARIFES